jgi:hypothetical protein
MSWPCPSGKRPRWSRKNEKVLAIATPCVE